MTLLREDRRSLAIQVRDHIWEAAQQGHYRPGDRLPSEVELATRFGISRATVREAFRILQEERLVLCRHGLGHFLAPDPSDVLSEEITRLKTVTEMARSFGFTLRSRILSLREEPAPENVRIHLNLEPASTVVVLERVRLAKDEAVIYSIDIFARRMVVGELRSDEFTGSLAAIMEEKWGVYMAYAKTMISAVMLDPQLSQEIGVSANIPWILMEQINFDPRDQPILYSKDYHRGDKMQFRVLRRRR